MVLLGASDRHRTPANTVGFTLPSSFASPAPVWTAESSKKLQVKFTGYYDDIQALYQATEAFINDCHDGENFLLSENDEELGLSVKHPTAKSILDLIDELVDPDMLIEADTIESDLDLLDLIDQYTGGDILVGANPTEGIQDVPKSPSLGTVLDGDLEQLATYPVLDSRENVIDECVPRLGAFFDIGTHQMVDYIALNQALYSSHSSWANHHADFIVDNDVSDMSDDKTDDSSTSQLSELTYFNVDTQQSVAYTAFNRLLHVEEDEMLPRIHRDLEDYFDPDAEMGVREIAELCLGSRTDPPQLRITNVSEFDGFDFQFAPSQSSAPLSTPTWDYLDRPVTLHSSKSKRRPQLTMKTQLQPILEEDEDAYLSTPSSEDSMDFADHRDYVKPLSTRRMNFIDDEDEDACLTTPSSEIDFANHRDYVKPLSTRRMNFLDDEDEDTCLTTPSSEMDFANHRDYVKPLSTRRRNFLDDEDEDDELESVQSSESSQTSDHSQATYFSGGDQFFDDIFVGEVWYTTLPDLALTLPSSLRPPVMLSPAESSPEPVLLTASEIEIYGLLDVVFERVDEGRWSALPELSKDLHCALSTLSYDIPIKGMIERLGAAVELLVEQLAV